MKNIANIHLIKCYKEVLNKNNIIKNYGFFIFAFINALFIISIVLFVCKSNGILKKQINDIILAKKYTKEKNNNSLCSNKNNKNKTSIMETGNNKENKKVNL